VTICPEAPAANIEKRPNVNKVPLFTGFTVRLLFERRIAIELMTLCVRGASRPLDEIEAWPILDGAASQNKDQENLQETFLIS
jgi:hypothetical protein